MPLTFIDIERQKNWRIAVFFAVLLLLYLAILGVIAATFFPGALVAPSGLWTLIVFPSILAAALHFWFSASDAVNAVSRSLDARPPDPDDSVHRTLANIMEELHVVTGNRRTITCRVIPSLSLNALAVADLRGNAMIGITEGLLSRLTRPQIEAVVAHEAHHILSADCLETTVAASIFGTLSSGLERIRYSSQGRAFAVPAVLLAWLLLQLGYLLNMFISRQREYRADAAAVRMNRNPLALAEALYLLSRSWRGAGFIGEGFEMLCIVNPQATALDESEGFVSDLLSTHPPLRTRINTLLAMVRVPVSELEARAAARAATRPERAPYFVLSPQQLWEGPFSVTDLARLPWLGPLTWLATQDRSAIRAWKDPAVNELFLARLASPEGRMPASSGPACPVCHQELLEAEYEGTRDFRCTYCGGMLIRSDHVLRILARTSMDNPCSDRVNALARAVLSENRTDLRKIDRRRTQELAPKLACPQCGNPMLRSFYSPIYRVQVDRCSLCGVTWFDHDEIEILQCMVENWLVSPSQPAHRPAAAVSTNPEESQ